VGPTAGQSHYVRCVEYGVENALGTNPVTIALYQDTDGGDPNNANLVPLASIVDVIPGGTQLALRTVDFTALNVVVPANAFLVVAVESPDLCAVGLNNTYFNGSNNLGETKPSYIKTAGCSIPDYVSLASIGFLNRHMVMTVELQRVPTCGDGVVEPPEDCDGGACCRADCTFVAGGTMCRPSTGVCDVAEACTGQSGQCPSDNCLPAGAPCDDGNPATCNDQCTGACGCVGGACGDGVCCGTAAENHSTCPGDCGACCLPNNGCTLEVTQDACVKLGGRYMGGGTSSCAHDAAGNCIPTVTEWGLLAMTLLFLTAATVVIIRRRAGTAA
jgi:hypothetical protein